MLPIFTMESLSFRNMDSKIQIIQSGFHCFLYIAGNVARKRVLRLNKTHYDLWAKHQEGAKFRLFCQSKSILVKVHFLTHARPDHWNSMQSCYLHLLKPYYAHDNHEYSLSANQGVRPTFVRP